MLLYFDVTNVNVFFDKKKIIIIKLKIAYKIRVNEIVAILKTDDISLSITLPLKPKIKVLFLFLV